MYYRKANAAMLIYDITSEDSFYDIKDWVSGMLDKYQLLKRHTLPHLFSVAFCFFSSHFLLKSLKQVSSFHDIYQIEFSCLSTKYLHLFFEKMTLQVIELFLIEGVRKMLSKALFKYCVVISILQKRKKMLIHQFVSK